MSTNRREYTNMPPLRCLTCEVPPASGEHQNGAPNRPTSRRRKTVLSVWPLLVVGRMVVSLEVEALLHLQQVPSGANASSSSNELMRAQHGNMSSMIIVPSSTPMTNASLANGAPATNDRQPSNRPISNSGSSSTAQIQSGGATKHATSSTQPVKPTNNSSPVRLKQQQQQAKPSSSRAANDNQMAADDTHEPQAAFMTISSSGQTSVGSTDSTASVQSASRSPNRPFSSEESADTLTMRPGAVSQSSNGAGGPSISGKTTITTVSSRANGWPSSQWRPKQTGPIRQQPSQSGPDGLDASLTGQLERPGGYSYGEPSPAGGGHNQPAGYTYVSQISPARQELMQATEQQQQLRNRARQHQFHQQSMGRAYEPLVSGARQQDHQLATEQLSISSSSSAKSASQLPQFNSSPSSSHQRPSSVDPFATAAQQQHQYPTNPCKPLYGSSGGQDSLLLGQMPASSNEIGSPSPVKYVRASVGTRLRSQYIFKVIRADSLTDCELACTNSLADSCRSFNYRAYFAAENCELSRLELRSLRLEDTAQFEQHTQFDFYALDPNQAPSAALMMMAASQSGIQQQQLLLGAGPFGGQEDCLDVSQSCTQEGMEFTLRTSEPFNGRIYTYGFYDSCFVDGQGSTSSQLRISRSNGFPRCGTQQFGDLMTNIVVVQFNDFVQTTRDKKYNLTCYFSGPGEAVVTSNYLDTKIDERSHPIQIEHLPPQNVVTSNVHLRILYRGQPTNTIAVGDLLTFRLETRSNQPQTSLQQPMMSRLRGELPALSSSSSSTGPLNEIFATNVIAKDPYSGRQVQLIDSRGCPIDPVNVFPELQRTPDGALESEFYAFKIPDSNFLIFQATVRTCKAPCEPVICQSPSSSFAAALQPVRAGQHQLGTTKGQYLMSAGAGGTAHLSQVPSWGKRRRRRRFTEDDEINDEAEELLSSGESVEHVIPVRMAHDTRDSRQVQTIRRPELGEAEQEVKEMFRVFMSRAEISKRQHERQQQQLIRQPTSTPTLADQATRNGQTNNGDQVTDDKGTAAEALSISGGEQLVSVCMTQSSYYVTLFTVISLSLILLSIASVSMYVTRRTKLHISDSIADSMY